MGIAARLNAETARRNRFSAVMADPGRDVWCPPGSLEDLQGRQSGGRFSSFDAAAVCYVWTCDVRPFTFTGVSASSVLVAELRRRLRLALTVACLTSPVF